MLITVTSDKYTPAGLVSIRVKRFAKYRLYRWELSEADIIIDNYCKKTYNCSLKEACLQIIKKIKIFPENTDNTYIIILPDKRLDKLAHIITYGNGEFLGSKILQEALKF